MVVVRVRVVVILIMLGTLGGGLAVTGPVEGHSTGEPAAEIQELYPNPEADGDPDEFITVHFPVPTELAGWRIEDDGRQEATLPDTTVVGTVAFSHNPQKATAHTDHEVYPLSGWIQLADSGETVKLVSDSDTVIDSVSYDRQAPEAQLYVYSDGRWSWQPVNEPTFSFPAVRSPTVESIVLPDGADRIYEFLETADRRLAIGGYTLTDERIVDQLIEGYRGGVTVTVLLEASPVGGICKHQAEALDRLANAGVDVRVRGGTDSRFRFHHAKYAIADNRGLVLTENWKPAGVGGQSSRGWAVIVDSPSFANQLHEVHTADLDAQDTTHWRQYRPAVDPVDAQQASGTYPEVFEPQSHQIKHAELLVGPDETASELRKRIDSASESIQIKQVQIGSTDFELLEATLDAARRGVSVEILLSGAWYAQAENEALVEDLQRTADREDLPVTIDIAQPTDRFGAIHAKGIIIDNEQVVVGSVNWNNVSLRENRELAVVLTGEPVAAYYGEVFAADREGESWTVRYGLVLLVIGGWTLTGVVLWWRLRWQNQ